MSSTNRGAIRSDFDFYITKPSDIVHFLRAYNEHTPPERNLFLKPGTRIFDPCAGGNFEPVKWLFKEGKECTNCGAQERQPDCKKHNGKEEVVFDIPPTPCSYPKALVDVYGDQLSIATNDIRPDSPAQTHEDFLKMIPGEHFERPDIIITNPPFDRALEIINHSRQSVLEGGIVIMLLRLNFFGSAKRKLFFKAHAPEFSFTHSERLGFTPDGKTDSIEYQHCLWENSDWNSVTALRVI